jgi:hypothetical protein
MSENIFKLLLHNASDDYLCFEGKYVQNVWLEVGPVGPWSETDSSNFSSFQDYA